jgi:putative membrane protein
MEGMGWGWIGLGALHMILFWLLIAVFLYALWKMLRGPGSPDALEILKARYAKGEITREQFEQMRRDLDVRI